MSLLKGVVTTDTPLASERLPIGGVELLARLRVYRTPSELLRWQNWESGVCRGIGCGWLAAWRRRFAMPISVKLLPTCYQGKTQKPK